MAPRSRHLAALAALLAVGCTQSPSPTASAVYVGRFADDVTYQPFLHTSGDDVRPDATTCFPATSLYCPDGGATLKVVVPGPGDPENAYAGGTMVSSYPRNLSGFDAVTFWARSVRSAPLVVGLGADQSDAPQYLVLGSAQMTTEWRQYHVPIPLPSRLSAEKGLFYFAAGADGSPATGFTFWLADVQLVNLGTGIAGPFGVLPPACVHRAVGDGAFAGFPSGQAGSLPVSFTIGGASQTVYGSSRYFTFESSAPGVASVDPGGTVSVQGNGTATVTARLGGTLAAGALTVTVGAGNDCPPLPVPTTVAPTPTLPSAGVISLFGSAYTAWPVNSWHTSWSNCCSEYSSYSIPVAGGSHAVKKFVLHAFNGVAISPDGSSTGAVDASAMRWFHVDVWTPDGFLFDVKLVNDPGGYASESTVRSVVAPAATWVGLDIPMSAFKDLGGTSKIGQMLFLVPDGTSATFYVDNVYFHD